MSENVQTVELDAELEKIFESLNALPISKAAKLVKAMDAVGRERRGAGRGDRCCTRRGAGRGGEGGEDLLRRHPQGRGRQEDPGDQGRPHRDGPRPQGVEGPRRRRPGQGEAGRGQGGGGEDQEGARGVRRAFRLKEIAALARRLRNSGEAMIADRRALEHRLQSDALTGLASHAAFDSRLPGAAVAA